MLDNSALIEPFVPETDDGDTFIYTEMLDRGQKKGNNGHRLVKTFYHRSREEFRDQLVQIKRLCDLACVRACTRLAPRSYKRVAGTFHRLVTETYITGNYAGMKSLYNRACGTTAPNEKLWLWDVDYPDEASNTFGLWLITAGHRRAAIPTKKGVHYITRPFDVRLGTPIPANATLHKDNPTVLYIPDNAD